MLSVPLNKRVKPSAKPTLLMPISCHQGPDMGKCRPGASRKVPHPQIKSAAPPPKKEMAIPVLLLLLLMVYFRHKGPYHANTS